MSERKDDKYDKLVHFIESTGLKVSRVTEDGVCLLSGKGPIELKLTFSDNEPKVWLEFIQKREIRILSPQPEDFAAIISALNELNSYLSKRMG